MDLPSADLGDLEPEPDLPFRPVLLGDTIAERGLCLELGLLCFSDLI